MQTKTELMPIAEFCDQKNVSISKVVERIEQGFYIAEQIEGEWFIDKSHLTNSQFEPLIKKVGIPTLLLWAQNLLIGFCSLLSLWFIGEVVVMWVLADE